MSDELLVAQRLVRRARQPAGLVEECLHLGQQAVGQHQMHTVGDARGERCSIPAQADLHVRHIGIVVEARAERTERAAAADGHLQRTHHPTSVPGLHPRRCQRIERHQFGVQRGRPGSRGARFQLGAQFGPLARDLHRIGDGPQIQAGAGDDERPGAARCHVVQRGVRIRRELREGVLLAGLGQVETMVTHPCPVDRRRLGRADVHASIDLHRVDGENLRARRTQRVGHRNVALARGGGPQHHERYGGNGRAHPASTGMRRRCVGSAITSTSRPRR
jgi:hypothetical protein